MQNSNPPGGGWNRRDFLKGSAAATAALLGLRPDWAEAQVPNQFDGSKFQLAAPEPNPKKGGTLKVGISSRLPHWDMHQSGTINSLGPQSCNYDLLVRRDPRNSGKTIIPDLAHSWEVSADNKTFTFHLREGVQFNDGAEFTSEDVKATFDRIRKPPAGVSIPRSVLFKSVDEIVAPDKKTVIFKLSEARTANFFLSSCASGWNAIFRKKTLEDNNYNLRRVENIPGTGPFKTKRRIENELWVMERHPNYWNKGLPYLDEIEFYHGLPFSPELGSGILSGRTEYIRITDPGTAKKAKETPGLKTAQYYQSVVQGTWMNNKKKPLDDARVRRAINLTLDKYTLVEVVKDITPQMVGGFLYPFSEFATPLDQLKKRVGYQEDPTAAINEAKALMAAAGYSKGFAQPLDYMVRDVPSFKVWSQAIQAMLDQGLGIKTNLRVVVESVWFDDTAKGNYDLAIGAVVSTLQDPSDYFNAWYNKDGPQNYSFWDNKAFQELVPQIDRETDAVKRLALIRKAEDIMEQDPPLIPMTWERINDVWRDYVKGHNPYEYFGLYDCWRLDTFWLDK
jgi:peptide/nickel transport system substrate-binding protein